MAGRYPRSDARISRRGLCLGTTSLLALGVPGLSRASGADVLEAIAEDFGDVVFAEGKILVDMPDFSDSGKSVPMAVTVPCSMEGLDYPEVVAVYAARNPRPRIVAVYFTPACSEATFSTRVRLDSYQDLTFVVKMATGEVFHYVRQVDVTYGACEQPVASDQFPDGWAPKIRLAVPVTAEAGAEAEIRTIISHPMETGFRHNSRGLMIPVRIAERFRCFANEKLAFSAKLEPAISANPYMAFHLKVDETTHLRFEWVETNGDIYTDSADITVA